jgi:hypothetical protein
VKKNRPGTYVMIFENIFTQKMAFLTQNKAKLHMQKINLNTGF